MGLDSPTVPRLVARALASHGPQPLFTWYDQADGARVELSVATTANWVSKTANLLQDSLGLASGSTVRIALPTHWLGAVWLLAAWSVGAVVTDGADGEADLAVVTAEEAGAATEGDVVAVGLAPLGGPAGVALPQGVLDFGAEVLGHGDHFTAFGPPGAGSPAVRTAGVHQTQQELVEGVAATARRCGLAIGGRLLTDATPTTADGHAAVLAPLLLEGSTVLIAHPDHTRLDELAQVERVTARLGRMG
ncbi:MAG: TIGR03089 family protein [Nocardioidaceae bacterium]